jgi:hypothetical protein
MEQTGTVPFLGLFLKDFEFINAPIYKTSDSGLINLMQKQKEFDKVCEIQLFQKATALYSITQDTNFNEWLNKQPTYTFEEFYSLSRKIEPDDATLTSNSNSINTHRKTKSSSSFTSRSYSTESLASGVSNFKINKTPSSASRYLPSKNGHSRSTSNASNDLNLNNPNHNDFGGISNSNASSTTNLTIDQLNRGKQMENSSKIDAQV